jgi:hypothetical protein
MGKMGLRSQGLPDQPVLKAPRALKAPRVPRALKGHRDPRVFKGRKGPWGLPASWEMMEKMDSRFPARPAHKGLRVVGGLER